MGTKESKDTHGVFRENSDCLVISQHNNILEGSSLVWGDIGPPCGFVAIALLAGDNLEVDEVNVDRMRPPTTTLKSPLLSCATRNATENP